MNEIFSKQISDQEIDLKDFNIDHQFSEVVFRDCTIRNGNFSCCSFFRCNFVRVKFIGVELTSCSFIQCKIEDFSVI